MIKIYSRTLELFTAIHVHSVVSYPNEFLDGFDRWVVDIYFIYKITILHID